jgi:hypothetical protein
MAELAYEVAFELNFNAVEIKNLKTAHQAVEVLNSRFDDLQKAVNDAKKDSGNAFDAIGKKLGTASVATAGLNKQMAQVGKTAQAGSEALSKFSKADDIKKANDQLAYMTNHFADAVREAQELAEVQKKIKEQQEKINAEANKGQEVGQKSKESGGGGLISRAKSFFSGAQEQANNLPGVEQATGGLGNLAGSLTSLANPATAAAVGVAAVGGAIIALGADAQEGAKEIASLQNEIAGFAGLTGNELRSASINIKSISDTFGIDSEKLINTINTISKNRKISFDQATNIVQDQLVRGGAFDDEFLRQLNEYDVQLKEIGLTAVQTGDFIRKARVEGFYDDKAVDALKEAQIKISEFSQATQDALKPLGPKFNQELEKGLKTGSKTAFQTFVSIAEQAKKVGLTTQQTQLLIADALGGSPGEDAGRDKLLKFILDFNAGLNQAREPLTAVQQSQLNLVEANKALNEQYAVFNDTTKGTASAFQLIGIQLKTFGLTIINAIAPAVASIGNFLADLIAKSQPIQDIFRQIYLSFSDLFNAIGTAVSVVFPAFNSQANATTTIVSLLSRALDVALLPLRAFTNTLALAAKGYATLINLIKQASNTLLDTNLDIDPKLSLDNFRKDLTDYGKLAKNGFNRVLDDQKKTQSQVLQDSKDNFTALRAQFNAPQSGSKPADVEIKIKADLKPFETAIQKAESDIQALADKKQTNLIQFEFDYQTAGFDFTEAEATRRATNLQERLAQVQLAASKRNAQKDLDNRKAEALANLQQQRLDNIKAVKESELSAGVKAQKLKQIEELFIGEIAKIDEASERDTLEMVERFQQEELVLRDEYFKKRTVQETAIQKKLLEQLLQQEREIRKTQRDLIIQLASGTDDFERRKTLLIEYYAEEQRILQENLDKSLKVEGLTAEEKANIIRKYNNENLALQFKFTEEVAKVEEARAQKVYEINLKAAERLESQATLLQNTLNKIGQTVKIGEGKNTDALAAQISAGSQAIGRALGQFADFKKLRADQQKQLDAANRDLDKFLKQRTAIEDQIAKNKDILTSDTASPEEKKKASADLQANNDALKDIDKKIEEGKGKLDELDRQARGAKAKAIIGFFETLADSIASAISAGIEATINQLSLLEQRQQEQIEKIKGFLDQGTKAKEKYNADELQLEEKRLDDIQKMKEDAVRQEQALAVAQLVAQSLVAIAKAAAEGGIAAPITIAATLIALGAGLAAAKSQAEAAIGFYKGGFTGYGNPHEIAGVVHKGEWVTQAKHVDKNRPVLEAIHKGAVIELPKMPPVEAFLPDTNWKAVSERYEDVRTLNRHIIHQNNLYKEKEIEHQVVLHDHRLTEISQKLSDLTDAIESQDIRVEQKIDERGIASITTKSMKREAFIRKKSTRIP